MDAKQFQMFMEIAAMKRLQQPNFPLKGTIPLVASKSESNRALIISALSGSPRPDNLSAARDTQTLKRILSEDPAVWDVLDAGAPMRFLTAYAAIQQLPRKLTGTARMQERPIGVLASALEALGANIRFENKQGYPPHYIEGGKALTGATLSMRGNVSSQFISAILLIAPYLPEGLELKLTDSISSRPYIDMTLSLMNHYGAEAGWTSGNHIRVAPTKYQSRHYTVESDWSGASYWYSMVALSAGGSLFLEGLRKDSFQGDSAIASLMESFGVETAYQDAGVLLKQTGNIQTHPRTIDCSDFPDLAQTLAAAAAALNIPLTLSGLHSLRIKETDRIAALQNELNHFGVSFEETTEGHFLLSGVFTPTKMPVKTYEDHRMAMAFAPLVLKQKELLIEDPEVVAKSYPAFWDHVELIFR
jgi:3-phosphoshikimate 1-carboxyvinyltransferase